MEDPAGIVKELAFSESGRASAPAGVSAALPALAVFAVALCIAFPQVASAYWCPNCHHDAANEKRAITGCVQNTTYCPSVPIWYASVEWWDGAETCWGPAPACWYYQCEKCDQWNYAVDPQRPLLRDYSCRPEPRDRPGPGRVARLRPGNPA